MYLSRSYKGIQKVQGERFVKIYSFTKFRSRMKIYQDRRQNNNFKNVNEWFFTV